MPAPSPTAPQSIRAIFAAVTARLAQWTNNGDPLQVPYAAAATWSHLNATHLNEAAVPPRIVWVPMQESYGPPVGQGGDGVNSPRPVATRQSAMEMHLWAAAVPQTGSVTQNDADLDACEQLLNAFMWAVYSVAHGAFQWGGQGRWSRGNVDGQLLTLGIGYILPVTFWIPVVRPLPTLATIIEIPATVALPNSSVLVDIT